MTNYQKLYTGIGRAAWGYFFLYFDFNINSVSILPSFVGYLLFLSAISLLQEEERELALLKTLGILLAVWHGAAWLASWISADLDGMLPIMDVVISVVNIYFHFQFLTNLASIAARHQPEGYTLDVRLLRCRTLQTIMLTIVVLFVYLSKWFAVLALIVSFFVMIVYLVTAILLMKALFDLRRCLSADPK